jgi:hypothetical protein
MVLVYVFSTLLRTCIVYVVTLKVRTQDVAHNATAKKFKVLE